MYLVGGWNTALNCEHICSGMGRDENLSAIQDVLPVQGKMIFGEVVSMRLKSSCSHAPIQSSIFFQQWCK